MSGCSAARWRGGGKGPPRGLSPACCEERRADGTPSTICRSSILQYPQFGYEKGSMDWITDLIALGDFEDSRDPDDVDAVLNVAAEAPVFHDLPCLHLKIEDLQPISRRDLKLALGFLTDRTAVGHRVLVHCWAGVSRSPAIVAAFIAMTDGISPGDALKMIQEKRRKADPDPVVWQSIIKGNSKLTRVSPVLPVSPVGSNAT